MFFLRHVELKADAGVVESGPETIKQKHAKVTCFKTEKLHQLIALRAHSS